MLQRENEAALMAEDDNAAQTHSDDGLALQNIVPRSSDSSLCSPSDGVLEGHWWLENTGLFDISLFQPPNSDDPWFLSSDSFHLIDEVNVPQVSVTAHNRNIVQRSWFTFVSDDQNTATDELVQLDTLSEVSDVMELGESFRARANQNLATQVAVESLPSAGLLVRILCQSWLRPVELIYPS